MDQHAATRANAGDYQIEYYYKGDANHNDVGSETAPSGTISCTISRADTSPTVSLEGWTYGETPNDPVLSEGGNPGGGEVVYQYKKAGDPDDAYTTTKPSEACSYVVRAVI